MKKVKVSPFAKRWANKKLLAAAEKSVLYKLATNGIVDNPSTIYEPFPLPEGYGSVWPVASEMVKWGVDIHATALEKFFDDTIVDHIVNRNVGNANVIEYKKMLTEKNVRDACLKRAETTWGGYPDYDGDNFHIICATSSHRLMTLLDCKDFEPAEFYMADLDRPLYGEENGKAVEYGRLKVGEYMYVVFLDVCDPECMESVLFGPGALTVTDVRKNLHAVFADNDGKLDVGWMMGFGAQGDPNGCVILRATKAVAV